VEKQHDQSEQSTLVPKEKWDVKSRIFIESRRSRSSHPEGAEHVILKEKNRGQQQNQRPFAGGKFTNLGGDKFALCRR
jgi:hypothetical protein